MLLDSPEFSCFERSREIYFELVESSRLGQNYPSSAVEKHNFALARTIRIPSRSKNIMKIIVGLGNPGLEYKLTKHNIGFEVISALAKERGIKINKRLHFSLTGKGSLNGEDVMLVLPQTYMNLSGKSVGEICGREMKDIKDLIVVCDDINIKLGRIRLRAQGSAGGHKGLISIISVLGRNDFARLRVGIATEAHKGDITRYVLSPFKRKDKKNVSRVIDVAGDALICIIEDGIEKAMAEFNSVISL